MNTTSNQKEGYVIVSLSGQELFKLKKMILGYGNFRKTLDKVGLPESTFRSILSKGYGTPKTIGQIKERLLEAEPISN